ncbi:MAG: hypothetical protein KA233_12060 [Novosphingobium sp.]|nr:hypothetical protein [Novosphingobium sp.]MBP6556402.1 hypothetical protein [Novosphingobium sp.]
MMGMLEGEFQPKKLFVIALMLLQFGCSDQKNSIQGYDDLVDQVEQGPVGHDPDHWIEFKNMAGEWEKTGLIFGYVGDFEECEKAIAGMKAANPKAEYRCVPANKKAS